MEKTTNTTNTILVEQYIYNTSTRELRWRCFLKRDLDDYPINSQVSVLSGFTSNEVISKAKRYLTRNGYKLSTINFEIKEKKVNGNRRNKRQTKQKI